MSEQTLNESNRFGTFLNANLKQVFGYFEQIYESVQKMTQTNCRICCQLTTKTTWKCNTDSCRPVSQFWSVTLNCMRDSKPQRYVQQPKGNATKQAFTNSLFKILCKYTQGMLSNRKICFNVLRKQYYNDVLCILSKINESVHKNYL